MVYLCVMHKVADWDKWKQVFDSNQEWLKEKGHQGGTLFQGAEDPNMVTVMLKWESLEQAKAFMADPELKEKMRESGAEAPEVHYMNMVQELG